MVSVTNLNGGCGPDRDRTLDRHTSYDRTFCELLSPSHLTFHRQDPVWSKLQLLLALTLILPNFELDASTTTTTRVHIYHHPSCMSYPFFKKHSQVRASLIYSQSTTNRMHLFSNLFFSVRRSTCFRRFFRPSSGTQYCTYGVRHLSDRYCYLLLAWLGWNCSSRLAAGGSNGLTNA